jgi:YD repeat-containing protein
MGQSHTLTRMGCLGEIANMPRTAKIVPGGMLFHVLNRCLDELLSVTDSVGNSTSYTYNAFGDVTVKTTTRHGVFRIQCLERIGSENRLRRPCDHL